jgi:hypothetical protein
MGFFQFPPGHRSSLPGRSPLQNGVEPETGAPGLVFSATYPWGSPPEAGKSCTIRIALINWDLRDMVDFVDLFTLFEPRSHKVHKEKLLCPAG